MHSAFDASRNTSAPSFRLCGTRAVYCFDHLKVLKVQTSANYSIITYQYLLWLNYIIWRWSLWPTTLNNGDGYMLERKPDETGISQICIDLFSPGMQTYRNMQKHEDVVRKKLKKCEESAERQHGEAVQGSARRRLYKLWVERYPTTVTSCQVPVQPRCWRTKDKNSKNAKRVSLSSDEQNPQPHVINPDLPEYPWVMEIQHHLEPIMAGSHTKS
jgi:hypothetical protein